MSIVSEKKFLIEEELQTLQKIQSQTKALIAELGEIELIKLQLENRHEIAKKFLNDLSISEQEFTQLVFEKYGKVNLNPDNGEITGLN
jgi:hypothetical protein